MEAENKRPRVVYSDSYDNEPFIFDCKWIDHPTQNRKEPPKWNFGKVITQIP